MSAEGVVAGYAVIFAAALLCQVLARFTGRLPTLGQAVLWFNSLRFGRPVLAAAWLWAGWHFFVRASWG
ncbi:MAG TPA: DUF6186 family protein [Actinomycetota bacterium]|nr:DUF6186 family protein [Actinomycetota bacterium]